jgi:uncharacterized membrane protein
MKTLVLTLHILSAVLIVGPLATSPWHGLRSIRQHDARGARDAGRTALLYTLLSLIVLGTGLLRVVTSDDAIKFGDVWVTISITLYIVMFAVGLAVVAPNLTRAAKMLDSSVPAAPVPMGSGAEVPAGDGDGSAQDTALLTEPAGTDTATLDVDHRRKLDAASGRIAAGGGLVTLLVVLLVIFSVTEPF